MTDDPADEPAVVQLSAADAVVERELLAAMSDGVYRQTGLTIRELADQLGHPEHRLRRLINGHLGFRNFSAFLNSYRLPEAKERLGDAKQVRIPVLTIALDLGYGSLGPFNRAFKADTGLTPTQYRQTTIRNDTADSE
jgi:AraC-like DNA-binding protein